MVLDGANILVTGGTGSFGRAFLERAVGYSPKRIVVLSRDELKQHELRQIHGDRLEYIIGDVRDEQRVRQATEGIDIIVHAAALKQISVGESHPGEMVKTNILGTINVIEGALASGVKKVLALSSDKAVEPVNLYGATKMAMERLMIWADGRGDTKFACVRYGNVLGSRGSVVPLFKEQRERGVLTITDERMTRFWITLGWAVDFVISSLVSMDGGEVFVLKLPSVKIADLAKALCPDCRLDVIGTRQGEKLHEMLVSANEIAIDWFDRYVVVPRDKVYAAIGQDSVPDRQPYTSDGNTWWLTEDEIRGLIDAG